MENEDPGNFLESLLDKQAKQYMLSKERQALATEQKQKELYDVLSTLSKEQLEWLGKIFTDLSYLPTEAIKLVLFYYLGLIDSYLVTVHESKPWSASVEVTDDEIHTVLKEEQ